MPENGYDDRDDERSRSLLSGSGASQIPWETAPLQTILPALYQTLLGALFAVPGFFAAVGRSRASLLRPCVFFVLLELFQNLAQRFWILSRLAEHLGEMPDSQAMLDAVSQSMSVSMLVIVAPPILILQWFLYSAMFHGMVRLVQPENASMSTTLRVLAYSTAPCLFSIVPVVGLHVSTLWFGICCFAGLKFALRLSWQRTAMAVLPLFALYVVLTLHLNKLMASLGSAL